MPHAPGTSRPIPVLLGGTPSAPSFMMYTAPMKHMTMPAIAGRNQHPLGVLSTERGSTARRKIPSTLSGSQCIGKDARRVLYTDKRREGVFKRGGERALK